MATNKNQIVLQIVVNGNPIEMNANVHEPLGALLVPALRHAGVAGEPDASRWVFKDQNGNVLDKEKKVGEFGFANEAVIFLSLEAGIAGSSGVKAY